MAALSSTSGARPIRWPSPGHSIIAESLIEGRACSGVGLLIPNVPRLAEWVYAGIAIDLLLAFYSQMNGGGSTWDKFDPILVTAFVFASYALRRCMRANRWSI